MDYITSFFDQVKYFFEQSQFTSQEMLLLVIVGIICLYIILWIPIRSVRLWYWRTNVQLNVLNSIDIKLVELKEQNWKRTESLEENASDVKPLEEIQLPPEAFEEAKEIPPIKQVNQAIRGYNIGKSGRVYSIEEVESMIKD